MSVSITVGQLENLIVRLNDSGLDLDDCIRIYQPAQPDLPVTFTCSL